MATVTADRPSNDDRIRAALWFAQRGFGIFPVWSTTDAGVCRCPQGRKCTSSGKHPITAQGFKDATRDPDRITTLLSAGSEPNYGLVNPDGVFTWDVDGEGWEARLTALQARYGDLPPTLTDDTAHGQHVFLRWPDGLPRPAKEMFGWVTRWGSGPHSGYVIGPNSVHASGKVYRPRAGGLDIATLPEEWATAALEDDKPRHGPVIGSRVTLPAVGARHDWLRDRARHYWGLHGDRAKVRALVMLDNASLDNPKTQDEVDRAIGEVAEKFAPDPVDEVEDRSDRRTGGTDELGALDLPKSGKFPADLRLVAFDGLLGECVESLADGTDASKVGLLGSMLAFAGALIPGMAYWNRTQTTSPFIALVGESSHGRKGTAMYRVRDAMTETYTETYIVRIMLDGLSSGEGLVSALAYKQSHFKNEPTVGFVFEEEYANLLMARGREGSTLDPRMRAAFDGSPLANRRRAESEEVLSPYWLPALIGITPSELRTRLEAGALTNGSANRWLYLPVAKRNVDATNAAPVFPQHLRKRLIDARRRAVDGPMVTLSVDDAVNRALHDYNDWLPTVSLGIGKELTKRLGITAFRIALIHAMAECADAVTLEYLERAMALVEYARSGLGWVFGPTVGSKDADLLYRHLDENGSISYRAIERQLLRDPSRRQAAIDELRSLDLARLVKVYPVGGGRARTDLAIVEERMAASFGTFWEFWPGFTTAPEGQSATVARTANSRTNDPAEPSQSSSQNSDRTVPEQPELEGLCQICGVGPFLSREFYDRHVLTVHPVRAS